MRGIVVGALRRRQGIGEFVARALHQQGAEVAAVVGTTDASTKEAVAAYGKNTKQLCRGYTDLEKAMTIEQPDFVAVCSPFRFHQEQVKLLAGRVHCLCEKPFWWPAKDRQNLAQNTTDLLDPFLASGKNLSLLTQWPQTLPYYWKLFPQLKEVPPTEFAMRMSPISLGPEMILDSAPHLFSMLHALIGPGEALAASARSKHPDQLEVNFQFASARGKVATRFVMVQQAKPPRIAGYSVNGHAAQRLIQMPNYTMQLAATAGWTPLPLDATPRAIPLPDPLDLLVGDFLQRIRQNTPTDAAAVLNATLNLEPLMTAVEQVQ